MKSILSSVFLLVSISTFCQKINGRLYTEDKKAIEFYQEAVTISKRAMFSEAIDLLQRAIKREINFLDAYHRMGYCYERLGRNQEAIRCYSTCLEIDSSYYLNRETHYWLGKLYFRTGNYNESISFCNKYLSQKNTNYSYEDELRKVLKNAQYSLMLVNSPIEFEAVQLPKTVNTFPQQYFPSLTADQKTLFYTARKGFTMAHDENIYTCVKDDSGRWSPPKSVSPAINSPANEGAVSISADGKIMIFTSCRGRNTYGNCDLFYTEKVGNDWKNPVNLGRPVNTPAWEAQPSLSADGRTLYFASSKSGGKGGRDIWVTHRDDEDTWTEPVNLGDSINTTGNEVSPFIHVNGQTLFFSSDYHPNLGGYDIFSSELGESDQHWTTPKNLGYPINTNDDQISLFITADGKYGYYTNDVRVGMVVESKLHYFEIPQEVQIKHKSSFLTGTIRDQRSKQPIESQIELFDIRSGKMISKVKSDAIDGTYMVVLTEGREYGVYVKKVGYVLENLSFNYEERESMEPKVLDIYLKPIESGQTTVLNNIFFAFDSYKLDQKSQTELREVYNFLKENKGVRIQIGGHTDNTGSNRYNIELSENRARTVYDFLIDNGVPNRLMEFKGYGSSKPRKPNDSEQNRHLNRRIEFMIID